jgi:hypothetical protein
MEILIIAILISAISIYGAVMLKRLYFLLGYFLFSLLALSSLIPTHNDDKMLSLTSIALFLVMGIISFPAKKNISDYEMNEEAKPLIKSFMLKTLLSLSAVNIIAIFMVKFDPNMPEGMTESMRIYPMIMHGVLGVLPLYIIVKMSQLIKLK